MTTKSRIVTTVDEIQFIRPDGTTEFTFVKRNVHESIRDAIYAYGLKQILADGGAVGRDATDEVRLNKMHKRAQSLIDGTWGYRDGTSTPTRTTSDYARQFECMVQAGLVSDDPAARAAWKSAKPAHRAAVWASDQMAPARDLYERSRPAAPAPTDLLAQLGIGQP